MYIMRSITFAKVSRYRAFSFLFPCLSSLCITILNRV